MLTHTNIIKLLLLVLVLTTWQTNANAQTTQGNVARVLESQGFEITEQKRTLLGRVKIEATNGIYTREIVILPATGEVLRDRLTYATGGKRGQNAWEEFLEQTSQKPPHGSPVGKGTPTPDTSANPKDSGTSDSTIPDVKDLSQSKTSDQAPGKPENPSSGNASQKEDKKKNEKNTPGKGRGASKNK